MINDINNIDLVIGGILPTKSPKFINKL